MKPFNFTIDKNFRNPFRWGRCPLDKHDPVKVYGVIFHKYDEVMQIKPRLVLIFNYGKKYKVFSNYPKSEEIRYE